MKPYQAIIFDLDGTLLDTLPGIAFHINTVLAEEGLQPVTQEEVESYLGSGTRALWEAILKSRERTEDIDALICRYKRSYQEQPTHAVQPYPSVEETLVTLSQRGVQLGIYTNKPQKLAIPMIQHFFKEISFVFVEGDDGRYPLKPNPARLEYLLQAYGLSKAEILYIGDSEVDAALARNAGMDAILVGYGYRPVERLEKEGYPVVSNLEALLSATTE